MKKANKTAKSRGIRFVSNITPNVTGAGSRISCADGISLQNEYVINDEQLHTVPAPYELTLDVDELIYPSNNPRRYKKTNDPPRPQNSFLLFRKDFEAKYRSLHQGEKIIAKKISSLAAQRWNEQPPSPNKKKDFKNNGSEKINNYLNSKTLPQPGAENSDQSPEIVNSSTTDASYVSSQDVVYDTNTFIIQNNYDYGFQHSFIPYNNLYNGLLFDIHDPASYNTALFETEINNDLLENRFQ
ncbi:13016_t:CDS:2 [Cetraspora pellucida]|uniref:13016_t:CDS:1 n=1 Tax=Cetraspora pellucida TaxID=1433469 RepID=A0A9N9N9S1_9GLOM|nr:13016_t:CDS:2 [Cetraspora pellucida]